MAGQQSGKVLEVTQADAKRVLAAFAHLKTIFNVATRGNAPVPPVEMNQADLILASASLRALFFDDTAILIKILDDAKIDIEIDCLETNLSMALLSHHFIDELHISDFLTNTLLDTSRHADFPYDKAVGGLLTFSDGEPYRSHLDRKELWLPRLEEDEDGVVGLGLDTGSFAPAQALEITRRKVDIRQWGRVRLGYLKNISILRSNIICYVANQLGGVHYDIKRFPKDANDAREFKALRTSYDWNEQAIMNAGLVAVGLACIELRNCAPLIELATKLAAFLEARQQRLTARTPV